MLPFNKKRGGGLKARASDENEGDIITDNAY